MKPSIVFFGASLYVLPLLAYLCEDFNLKLILTTEQKENGPIHTFAKKHIITCISVTTLREPSIITRIKKTNATVAVLANFGLIIPGNVMGIFPKGIINIHPSLLPKYRGPTPGQNAILQGDKTPGVSIMLLDELVDHGPILGQKKEPLSDDETAQSFYERSFISGTALLKQTLPKYLSGSLIPLPQNHSKATFTKTLVKKDGFINTSAPIDKTAVTRMVRAYYPWPGVWTIYTIEGTPLTEKVIKFLPQGNHILLQVEGKKPMTKKDFLNGYPFAKQWLDKIL